MPDTPTKALEHSETRDILQGAKHNADTLVTECKFVPAAALDGLAANLATLLEWSRLQDNDASAFSSSRMALSTWTTLRPLFAAPTTMRCAARATS